MRNADTSYLLLEEGRKTEALEISTHCGGGAVNAAVAMARLGCDVATIVKLGQDKRAETVLSRLNAEAVSTRGVVQDARAPTGASVIISSHDRNAAIFTFRGANGLLESKDFDGDAHDNLLRVDLVHISSLSDGSADCFLELVTRAKSYGALVSANPGVRQLSARSSEFRSALSMIDILALNRAEADVLVPSLATSGSALVDPVLSFDDEGNLPALVRRGLTSGGHQLGLASFMQTLRKLGPRFVLLTDGSAGSFVGCPDEILYCPAIMTKVAGTAGAGDAFAATFATMIGRKNSTIDAVRAATINASAVLAYVDTQSGLMTRETLERKLLSMDGPTVRRWKIASRSSL